MACLRGRHETSRARS